MKKLILALLVVLLTGIANAEVTGRYKLTYTDVSELTDTLQLDFADTISNPTVTFIGKGVGSGTFDNSGGGSWQRWAGFVFVSAAQEYAQYKLIINGSSWKLYNVTGSLEGSGTVTDFWSLVKSDGSDIRVFDQNGNQLYFWIESWDYANQTAVIWVNVSSGSSELNIAYGNPSALPSSYNDGSQVFEFFDNHNDGILDPNKFTALDGTWSESNGELTITTSTTSRLLVKYNLPVGSAVLLKVSTLFSSDTTDWVGIGMGFDSSGTPVAGSTYWGLLNYWRINEQVEFYTGTATVLGTATHSLPDYFIVGFSDSSTITIIAENSKFTVSAAYPSSNYFTISAPNGMTLRIDYTAVVKLTDPTDVSSFKTGTFEVVNPKLILNGNVIEYQGNLTAGQSVTLNISSSYFVIGTNNVTITSDNRGVMDVIIEFNYSYSVSETVTDKGSYLSKSATINVPANALNARYRVEFPLRTKEFKYEVVGPAYNVTNSSNSVAFEFPLSPRSTYSITVTVRYLLFNVKFYDETTLNKTKVNVTVQNYYSIILDEYKNVDEIKIFGSDNYYFDKTYFLKISGNIYDRTVAIRTNKLNTTVKVLVLNLNDPAVNVVFQLNDPFDIYSQGAIIRIFKYLNNETYEVVSDKVDSQGKVSAILKHNEKYFISVLDYATWQESAIGEYTASKSETKIITPYAATLSNVTTFFDYVNVTAYTTKEESAYADANGNVIIVEEYYIVGYYEDSSGKTSSIAIEIYDDSGGKIASIYQTGVQKLSLTKRVTSYKSSYFTVKIVAQTDYGKVVYSKVLPHPKIFELYGSPAILVDVKYLLPGPEITGFSKDFTLAALSFVALLFFAGLFSKRNARTGALVVAIGAGMLWLFGWLPAEATVVALVIFLAILGKYEEGYRK